MEQDGSIDIWSHYYERRMFPTWPSELLVRSLKGSYIDGNDKNYKGKKVLDIGFGDGGNLFFLDTLEMNLYGVELSQKICEVTQERLTASGVEADLRVGSNADIPFPDGYFDLLVSWNVVHYGPDLDAIDRHISEYARVTKTGGRIVVASVGPEDDLAKTAELVGERQHKINLEGDHRRGEIYYYFGTQNFMRSCFKKYFTQVKTGREKVNLFDGGVDSLLLTAVK